MSDSSSSPSASVVSLWDGRGRRAAPVCILSGLQRGSLKKRLSWKHTRDTMTSPSEVWKFLSSWITFTPFLFLFCLCLVCLHSPFSFFSSVQVQGENQCDDTFLHMQAPAMQALSPSPWSGCVEVRAHLCPPSEPNPTTRSLRRPGRRQSHSPPPPFRSCSIPIIPSVQCHHDNEVSCMQTTPATTTMSVTCGATPCKEEKKEKAAHAPLFSSSCSSAIGRQQDEVALLLEEAQEQLRALALAHRKQEGGGVFTGTSMVALVEARETVCFLNVNGGSAGALSCNGPTQTQLLSPSLSHRDLGQTGQWEGTI